MEILYRAALGILLTNKDFLIYGITKLHKANRFAIFTRICSSDLEFCISAAVLEVVQ